MPASTMRTLTGRKYMNNFVFKPRHVLHTERVTQDILRTIAARHRFDPRDTEALTLWDTTEHLQFMTIFMFAFRVFLGIIGLLTLVVGGIGVSNIMNVVVEERTFEIGVKMALGAKSRAILGEFLLETLLLTTIGGTVGLVLTAAVCAVARLAGIEEYVGAPVVSWSVAAVTAFLLGAVGLTAGYFPSRDAARLDPVLAMKQ